MKKLFLLSALLVFTFGFGQNSDEFNFDDIRNISSAKLFKKFCFENEFVYVDGNSDWRFMYAKGYIKGSDSDKDKANIWAFYYSNSKTLSFQFSRNYDGSSVPSFQNILNQVKKQCKFYDFKDDYGDEYICYSCSNSSYKGKIGFFRGKDGLDYIETFDF